MTFHYPDTLLTIACPLLDHQITSYQQVSYIKMFTIQFSKSAYVCIFMTSYQGQLSVVFAMSAKGIISLSASWFSNENGPMMPLALMANKRSWLCSHLFSIYLTFCANKPEIGPLMLYNCCFMSSISMTALLLTKSLQESLGKQDQSQHQDQMACPT